MMHTAPIAPSAPPIVDQIVPGALKPVTPPCPDKATTGASTPIKKYAPPTHNSDFNGLCNSAVSLPRVAPYMPQAMAAPMVKIIQTIDRLPPTGLLPATVVAAAVCCIGF